jgi:isoleucyl-tRNA synthetase
MFRFVYYVRIDHITIPGKNGTTLRRIPEVFDCWFESGSMPYAQHHYPFENKEKFEGLSCWVLIL